MLRRLKFSVFMAALMFMALATSMARALEGRKAPGADREGPVQRILDHATELNLSADQKTKLEALQKETTAKMGGEMREKFKDNPEAQEIFKELKAARDSGDETKLKAAREKYRAFALKNGAGDGKIAAGGAAKMGELREKLSAILNPEQLKQVKEILDAARSGAGAGAGGGTEKGQKPDTSKEAPKVFE